MARIAGYLLSAMLVIVGVIHLLPLMGVFGVERLEAVYGVVIDDPNLAILLRHRAVLFGIFGAFMFLAAFTPGWRFAALIGGFISVVSFVWLAKSVGGYNPLVQRVVTVDLVALGCLCVAAAAYFVSRKVPA
jgi:hypothetical protein